VRWGEQRPPWMAPALNPWNRLPVQVAALPSADEESCLHQSLQMKRQRRRRNLEPRNQLGRCVPLGAALHE